MCVCLNACVHVCSLKGEFLSCFVYIYVCVCMYNECALYIHVCVHVFV